MKQNIYFNFWRENRNKTNMIFHFYSSREFNGDKNQDSISINAKFANDKKLRINEKISKIKMFLNNFYSIVREIKKLMFCMKQTLKYVVE